MEATRLSPRWMSQVLAVAGAYNLAWAAWMFLFPEGSFSHSGMDDPGKPLNYPQLWQGVGVLVGVFGIGYLLAATNPVQHWGLVFVGLISKVLGGLGTALGVASGQNRPEALLLSLLNDLVWWIPFILIVRHARRASRGRA